MASGRKFLEVRILHTEYAILWLLGELLRPPPFPRTSLMKTATQPSLHASLALLAELQCSGTFQPCSNSRLRHLKCGWKVLQNESERTGHRGAELGGDRKPRAALHSLFKKTKIDTSIRHLKAGSRRPAPTYTESSGPHRIGRPSVLNITFRRVTNSSAPFQKAWALSSK